MLNALQRSARRASIAMYTGTDPSPCRERATADANCIRKNANQAPTKRPAPRNRFKRPEQRCGILKAARGRILKPLELLRSDKKWCSPVPRCGKSKSAGGSRQGGHMRRDLQLRFRLRPGYNRNLIYNTPRRCKNTSSHSCLSSKGVFLLIY